MKNSKSLLPLLLLAACGGLGSKSNLTASSGTFDEAFSTNLGSAFTGTIEALKVQVDGKILVGGSFTGFNGQGHANFLRLNADGTLDASFESLIGSSADDTVYAIDLDSAGNIYLGGNFSNFNGLAAAKIVKLDSAGLVSSSYSANVGTGFDQTVSTLIVDSSDSVLVGGNFGLYRGTNVSKLARLSSVGNLDTNFNAYLGTGFNLGVDAIVQDSSGGYYVGGSFTSFQGALAYRLVKLKETGEPDAAMNSFFATAQINSGIRSLVFDAFGGLLVGGSMTLFNGAPVPKFFRISFAGSSPALDTDFSGTWTGGLSSTNANVMAVYQDSQENVYVGGDFTAALGSTAGEFVGLDSSGTVDATYTKNMGTGFGGGQVRAIVEDSKGALLVGGDFTQFNSKTAKSLVRLK